jgi:pimeloyl-ACP methyl ester carboxylesterase
MLSRSVTSIISGQTLATLREYATMAGMTLQLPTVVRVGRQPVLIPLLPDQEATSDMVATPVLLIHGYLGTEECWTHLLPRLQLAGFHHVSAFRYNSLMAGIPELAADLVVAARSAMEQAGHPRIHLVGHSLGGLVARYAVQRLGLDAATLGIVTIATPHKGSTMARVAPGRSGAQMRPGSSLLAELPPLAATRAVSWAIIDSDNDLLLPSLGAMTSPHPGSVLLHGHGHHTILRSPDLADAVVAHLLAAEIPRTLRSRIANRITLGRVSSFFASPRDAYYASRSRSGKKPASVSRSAGVGERFQARRRPR